MCQRFWTSKVRCNPADFWAEQRGSMAVTFAFTLLVLFMAIGAAIDFGRTRWAASKLQAILDSATLAAAKETSDSKRQQVFDAYFAANQSLLSGM